jgi:hypothetical protein
VEGRTSDESAREDGRISTSATTFLRQIAKTQKPSVERYSKVDKIIVINAILP